jgi:large subunit ribosomal protein L20
LVQPKNITITIYIYPTITLEIKWEMVKMEYQMRVKRAQNKKVRTKKLFKRAKGFFLARSKTRRQANEAVMKARQNAFVGRKQRKRHFRSLWIARINAAARLNGISYSAFVGGLKRKGIEIDRKVLADLAVHNPEVFAELVTNVNE